MTQLTPTVYQAMRGRCHRDEPQERSPSCEEGGLTLSSIFSWRWFKTL